MEAAAAVVREPIHQTVDLSQSCGPEHKICPRQHVFFKAPPGFPQPTRVGNKATIPINCIVVHSFAGRRVGVTFILQKQKIHPLPILSTSTILFFFYVIVVVAMATVVQALERTEATSARMTFIAVSIVRCTYTSFSLMTRSTTPRSALVFQGRGGQRIVASSLTTSQRLADTTLVSSVKHFHGEIVGV